MPDKHAHPPHHEFDPREYAARYQDRANTNNILNRAPYSPADIKAAHDATATNIAPALNKKRVTIAIVIAYNWPADYIQSCFDAMCRAYGLVSRQLEVINLNVLGNKYIKSSDEASALIKVNAMISAVKTYVGSDNSSTTATPVTEITYFNKVDALKKIAEILPTLIPITTLPITSSSAYSLAKSQLNWMEELLLDLWAFAMNPNANIRIIGATNSIVNIMLTAVMYASTDSNFIDSPYGATNLVTMSWGGNAIYEKNLPTSPFINKNICYFASTGDYSFPTYPATSPDVLAVGGTSMYYEAAKGVYNSVWNTPPSASGTGFARTYAKPSYQNNLPVFASAPYNTVAYNKRCVPDVSSLADPATGVLIFITDGNPSAADAKIRTKQLAGTSLASPILCGLFSHSVQMRINDDKTALTTIMNNGTSVHLQTILYGERGSSALFYDVTDGSVSIPVNADSTYYHINTGLTFVAEVGHDIPSGLGVPKMNNTMISRIASVQSSSDDILTTDPPSELIPPTNDCGIPWTDVCGCESCYLPYVEPGDTVMFIITDIVLPSMQIGDTLEVYLFFHCVTGTLHAMIQNRLLLTVIKVDITNSAIADEVFNVTPTNLQLAPIIVAELEAGNTLSIVVSNPSQYAVGTTVAVAISTTRKVTGVIHAIIKDRLLITVTTVTHGAYSPSEINVPSITQ
uniref:Peptidase S53 domain-containing protein n=1 Tax=viral metagenome TaxID=1070528 RepID=A0A6C0M1F6_9ZZZZ